MSRLTEMTVVVGLDLAGVEARPSGLCVLEGLSAKTKVLHTDKEIITEIKKQKPAIIAIDAPLSIPKERASLEERSPFHLRGCDRELRRRGIKFFPVTLGPMRKLTQRGIKLKNVLESQGARVIEVYPGGAQDILSIGRKQKSLAQLRAGLEKLGITGLHAKMSHDELDAVTCAFVGKLYLAGLAELYGDEEEGQIAMPQSF